MNAPTRADGPHRRPGLRRLLAARRHPSGTLDECLERGADLAVLPEIPLNPWRPATKDPTTPMPEPMDGPRARRRRRRPRHAIGLVGGIIHGPRPGRRTSRVLVFDRAGAWGRPTRSSTFRRRRLLGDEPLRARHAMRRSGSMRSACRSACRSAPTPTARRARTSSGRRACGDRDPASLRGAHLPAMEDRVARERAHERLLRPFGRPPVPRERRPAGRAWIAIDPNGRFSARRTTRSAWSPSTRSVVADARVAYPGYLPVRAGVYADAWDEVAGRDGEPS